jgi:hypothetical protein
VKTAGLVPTLLFCSLLSVDACDLWPDADARGFIQKAALELRRHEAPEAAALATEAEWLLGKETLTLNDIQSLAETIERNIRTQLGRAPRVALNTDSSGND